MSDGAKIIRDPKHRFRVIVADLSARKIGKDSFEHTDEVLKLFIEAYPLIFVIGFYDVDNIFIFSDVRDKNAFVREVGPYGRMRPTKMYTSVADMTRVFNEASFDDLACINDLNEMRRQMTFMYEVLVRFDVDVFLAETAIIERSQYSEKCQRCVQRIIDDGKF